MAEGTENPCGPWLPPALGFVAGYVDTCGFIALAGLFTAHVTGNFVLIGAALVGGSGGLVMKLLALPTFVVSVAAVTAFVRFMPPSPERRLAQLLVAQAVLVAAFGTGGTWLGPFDGPSGAAAIAVGMLGVAAMSVQNAGSRLLLGSSAPSTVMTGNVTQMVIDAVSLWRASPADAAATKRRLSKFAWPLAGFASGAVVGAWLLSAIGFRALLVPAFLLAVLALAQSRRAGR